MKDYIHQFYNEGFATTFCLKPIKYLNKKIKNEKFKKGLINLIRVVYTILVIAFAFYVFYKKFPFK